MVSCCVCRMVGVRVDVWGRCRLLRVDVVVLLGGWLDDSPPRRVEVYSSNAMTAARLRVSLNARSTRPAVTRFVFKTGATFHKFRIIYRGEDDAAAMIGSIN